MPHEEPRQEIKITPEMIEAGVSAWREFRHGQRETEIVDAIYFAMEIERKAQASATVIISSR